MSKLIMFNLVTLDGFFAGPNGEIDWHRVDAEFNNFAIAQLNSAAGLVFGRKTYDLMAGYWPTDAAIKDDPMVAGLMNSLPKIVFSRTLARADWNNTRLLNGNIAEEITRLKQSPGKDWLLFGSANLASTFTRLGLIDEYRLMVNPVILGSGQALFQGVPETMALRLANNKTFGNGNVLLSYQPDKS